jgi:hypothetical protein
MVTKIEENIHGVLNLSQVQANPTVAQENPTEAQTNLD